LTVLEGMTGLFVVLGLAAVLFGIRQYLLRKERTVAEEREDLHDEEIFRRFYETSGLKREAVLDVWHEVARCLKLRPGQLRPSDEFGRSFGRTWLTSDALEELEQYAKRRMRTFDRDVDLTHIRTVDDFVRAFSH